MMTDWYRILDENEVDTPALLVYPARIRHNLILAKAMIGDVNRLRPHVKTHKTHEVLKMQMDVGIRKFKCATIAEAQMLGEAGAPDVLFAYPLYGPKLRRFIQLVKLFRQTKFSAVVDHEAAADALSDAAQDAGSVIDVYIDLDIGMGRTGILPDERAVLLYQYCHQLKALNVQGFHAYDGHVREVDLEKRKIICNQNLALVSKLVLRLESDGLHRPRIIIGGSPSFPVYSDNPELECSPGTFALWDFGYGETLPEQRFVPAAVLMCRVVSLIGTDRICVDLGYKAVASENSLAMRAHFFDNRITGVVSQSEEHFVLSVQDGHGLCEGDALYALPWHICPTVALYDRLMVVQEGRVADSWQVSARQR